MLNSFYCELQRYNFSNNTNGEKGRGRKGEEGRDEKDKWKLGEKDGEIMMKYANENKILCEKKMGERDMQKLCEEIRKESM